MRNHLRIGILLLAAVLLAVCFACAKPAGTASQPVAYDFSDAGVGLPAGWTVNSYEGIYETTLSDGVFGMSTEIDDDMRLCCSVKVDAQTRYVLTAMVRTEGVVGGQGATLSIDNYATDGSFIYSDGLFGTNDWTKVVLAFRTAKEQDRVVLALRLGGYSNVSHGRVWFKDVVLEQTDSAPVAFQNLVVRDKSEESGERTQEDYENVFTVIFWSGVIAAIVLLFGCYPKAKTLAKNRDALRRRYLGYCILALIGLLVRFVLCAKLKGHATDMSCWQGWGYRMATYGPHAFYVDNWCDYPPGYMLVAAGLYRVSSLFSEGPEALRLFVYMIPAYLCDVVCGILMLHAAKRFSCGDRLALLLAGLIVLNPAAVYLSGAWGQIDSILTAMLLGVFLLLNDSREKPYLRLFAGLLYGAAILVKWQALIFGPVLALMYVMLGVDQFGTKKFVSHVLWSFAAVAGAVGILLLGSLLFRGEGMPLTWMIERYQSASGGYDYATVEAYNWFALLSGNWTKVGKDVFDNANVWGVFLQCNALFSKVAVLIALPTLVLRAFEAMRARREKAANPAVKELALVCVILVLLRVLNFAAESADTDNTGVQTVLNTIADLKLSGVFLIGFFAYLVRTERKGASLAEWCKAGGAAVTGTLTMLCACVLFGFTLLLGSAARLGGMQLSFKAFGTIGIVFSGAMTLWAFSLYWVRHRSARYSLYCHRGLIFLLGACFNVWVFTFGHFMHERYIFPALFLLLFAYAFDRDRHKLAAFCMLTVTTFLNEMTAMFVVSDGAIELIRGGAVHNKMIALVSLLEVGAALYLTATCIRTAFLYRPDDPCGEQTEPEKPQIVKRRRA